MTNKIIRLNEQDIETIVRKNKPDHIYCQLIRCTEYVKHIHDIPKTLDYMDTFSKGMERRIEKSVFYMLLFGLGTFPLMFLFVIGHAAAPSLAIPNPSGSFETGDKSAQMPTYV